jgi:hypothetical protein
MNTRHEWQIKTWLLREEKILYLDFEYVYLLWNNVAYLKNYVKKINKIAQLSNIV